MTTSAQTEWTSFSVGEAEILGLEGWDPLAFVGAI
jgi:hypothetical protein